ncbi:MAG: hypothetical protein SOZ66_07845 [Candidatus Cryptobacteroides sp.]|nr:hypothetical protein [Candidatus Cryptobacteroides sp.]
MAGCFWQGATSGEIHLNRQCALEGILKVVGPKGEFHGIALAASEALLTWIAPTGEIHLKRERHYDPRSIERMMVSERREYLREVKDKLLAKQYGIIIIP